MSGFNIRAVPVLRYIDKPWLKILIFSTNETLLKTFSMALFRFFNISYISQNYRLMEIMSTNTNGEFKIPADIKNRVSCHES